MKKLLALLLALTMVFALCACGAKEEPAPAPAAPAEEAAPVEEAAPALEPIVIEFATPNADANIESQFAAKWIEAVEEASEGAITFNYTPGGALGNYEELLEGTMNGVYNLTITEPSYLEAYVPESAIMSLPMLYGSYDEVTSVVDGEVGQWYNGLVRDNAGLEVLNYFYCGFRYIITQDEVTKLSDITDNGIIMRSPNIQVYLDTLQKLGFKCETMSFADAYSAMETGVISAVECPLQNLYGSGYYNMCDYLLGTRHLFSANCIVANGEWWAELPAEYVEILTSTLAEVTAAEREQCITNEQDLLAAFEAEGVVFNEFDAESKTQINEMFAEYWIEKISPIGDEALAKLQTIIDAKA